jgi:aspartate/methionine/tyrosine aminotransferase
VAAKLAAVNGLTYDPNTEILITTGATFGIYAALMALVAGREEVLLPDPIYDAYQSPIRLAGGAPAPVPSSVVNGRFVLEPDALERAWTPASRVLLLNTPWNPTGTVFTAGELSGIAAFCKQYSVTLISDEIYEAITYDGAQHVSPAAVAPGLRDRCVLVNALSKTYSMTGWRVGYCAGPAHLIQRMFLILQQSSRGPATFVQDAAAAALTGPQDCVRQMQAEYAARRHKVIDALSGIDGVRVLAPEGGFFAMVDVRALGLPSGQLRRRLMHDHGVVVVHGAAYGEGGEGAIRVSFASGGDTLDRGLDRLAEGLRRIS